MRPLPLPLLPLLLAATPAAAVAGDDVPAVEGPVAAGSASPSGWRCYGDFDYLQWWLREGRLPATVTTGPTAGQGVLGQPGTSVVYGDDRLTTRHGDKFSGLRFCLGAWLGPDQQVGVEVGGFFLERDSTYFSIRSDGSQLLARPYVDAVSGLPTSLVFAGPSPQGPLAGGFNGYSRVEFFSEEGNAVFRLTDTPVSVTGFVGARFLQLRDRTDLTTVRRLPAQSTLQSWADHYRAHDAFYGAQVGLKAEYRVDRWLFRARGLVALGADLQTVRTFGDHIDQAPLVRVDSPGGLLVQASNAGTADRMVFDALYEVGVEAGYQLTDHCRVSLGYTFLGWNNPVRSGDQVDPIVNPTQLHGPLAGPARPAVPFKEDFFWAQGLTANLEFGW